jgi:hypothetical protein
MNVELISLESNKTNFLTPNLPIHLPRLMHVMIKSITIVLFFILCVQMCNVTMLVSLPACKGTNLGAL